MNDIIMSYLMPSVYPHLWARCYSRLSDTDLKFELIICCPVDLPAGFHVPANVIVIKTKVKPVQCWQIAAEHSTGKFVSLMADDIEISDHGYDEAVAIYEKQNDYKTIVSLKYIENGKDQTETLYYPVQKDSGYSLLLPGGLSVMSRKFFSELGGYDKKFIQCNAELDLFLRAISKGANIQYCENANGKEDRLSNHFRAPIDSSRRLKTAGVDRVALDALWRNNIKNNGVWLTNPTKLQPSMTFEPFDVNSKTFKTVSQGTNLKNGWD